MRPRLLLSIVGLFAATATSGAQPTYLELQPGAQVKVGAESPLRGTVLSRGRDSVVIAGKFGQVRLALAQLRGVEVYRGRSRSMGAARGTAWGAGLGLLIGAASASDSSVNHPAFAAYMAFNGALVGAAIGAIAGRERWVPYGEQSPGSAGVVLGAVPPGTRVRVTAPGALAPGFTGVLLDQRADSIRVTGESGVPVAIPTSAISRIERSAGRGRARGAVNGAAWGGLIGGAGFGLVAAAVNDGDQIGEAVLGGATGGAFWGAVIGAAVGTEAWREVSPVTAMVRGPRGTRALNVGLRLRVN